MSIPALWRGAGDADPEAPRYGGFVRRPASDEHEQHATSSDGLHDVASAIELTGQQDKRSKGRSSPAAELPGNADSPQILLLTGEVRKVLHLSVVSILLALVAIAMTTALLVLQSPPYLEDVVTVQSGTHSRLVVSGTDSTVEVASAEMRPVNGTLRELESDSAVATTTVVSYAHILDLLDLPVDALRRMGDICVKTTDGNQQCFSVVGFLAEVHEKHGGPRLDILTSAASTAIQIHRDHAVLVMGKSKKDIELSGAENAHTRRRKLREHANDDRLHLRCARNQGPCLYTSLEELRTVKLLDVGYDGALSSTRRLQQSNDDGNFATLTADPYAVLADTGYVDWDAEEAEDDTTGNSNPTGTNDIAPTRDVFGCPIESGFESASFPVSKNLCYSWLPTEDCTFSLTGGDTDDVGYDIIEPVGAADDFIKENDEKACTEMIPAPAPGVCVCGSGFKMKAGECDADMQYPFTCEDVCAANSVDEYDLYGDNMTQQLFQIRMEEEDIRRFFEVSDSGEIIANAEADFTVAAKVGYRRVTPSTGFGTEDLPTWLTNQAGSILAHYTTASWDAASMTWQDVSGNARHASVSGADALSITTLLNSPAGSISVLEGTHNGTVIEFPLDTGVLDAFHTVISVARYDPNGSHKQRILSSGYDWYDGFEAGEAGVFGRNASIKAPMGGGFPDSSAWILSSSSVNWGRANFIERFSATFPGTPQEVLNINKNQTTASDFQIAELLVLRTASPLSVVQKEDIERWIFLRNAPLFMKARYGIPGEPLHGDTWPDLSPSGFDCSIDGDVRVVQETREDGAIVRAAGGSTITCPVDIAHGEFTLLSVADGKSGLLNSATPLPLSFRPSEIRFSDYFASEAVPNEMSENAKAAMQQACSAGIFYEADPASISNAQEDEKAFSACGARAQLGITDNSDLSPGDPLYQQWALINATSNLTYSNWGPSEPMNLDKRIAVIDGNDGTWDEAILFDESSSYNLAESITRAPGAKVCCSLFLEFRYDTNPDLWVPRSNPVYRSGSAPYMTYGHDFFYKGNFEARLQEACDALGADIIADPTAYGFSGSVEFYGAQVPLHYRQIAPPYPATSTSGSNDDIRSLCGTSLLGVFRDEDTPAGEWERYVDGNPATFTNFATTTPTPSVATYHPDSRWFAQPYQPAPAKHCCKRMEGGVRSLVFEGGDSGFDIADLIVLNLDLPRDTLLKVLEKLEQFYGGLGDNPVVEQPAFDVAPTFTIFGGDATSQARWANGGFMQWQIQAPGDYSAVAPTTNGVSDYMQALSTVDSGTLEGQCVQESVQSLALQEWGWDPIVFKRAALPRGLPADGFALQFARIAFCRRLTQAQDNVAAFDDSTVCGLDSLNSENPTCMPRQFLATWEPTGVWFRWRTGCKASFRYQILRNRQDQIGGDFLSNDDPKHDGITLEAKREMCLEKWIDPEQQLVDMEVTTEDYNVGETIEYCVRGAAETPDGLIVTSEYLCTATKVAWMNDIQGQAIDREGRAIAGVLIDAVLCPNTQDAAESCARVSNRKLREHYLEDGRTSLVFSSYSSSPDFITVASASERQCLYDKFVDNVVRSTDKPDWVVLIDDTQGVVWHRHSPSCFLKVRVSQEPDQLYEVLGSGGLQRTEGAVVGSGFHIVLERYPSWEYMAKNCRSTCGLSGLESQTVGDEVYRTARSADLETLEFCAANEDRCPRLDGLSDLEPTNPRTLTSEQFGAVLFGSDSPSEGEIRCSFFDGSLPTGYAYWNASLSAYDCCEALPDGWDSCGKRFTDCAAAEVAPLLLPVPKKAFRLRVESTTAIFDEEQSEYDWLSFEFGTDNSDSAHIVLVDPDNAIGRSAADLASEAIQVENAWAGPSHQLISRRTDDAGEIFEQIIENIRGAEQGPVSRVRRLFFTPFRTTSLPTNASGSVVTTKHTFVHREAEESATGVNEMRLATMATPGVFTLEDVTSVQVPISVRTMLAETACSVPHILMCAYRNDTGVRIDCQETDDAGDTVLSVPAGISIALRNGCPVDEALREDECPVAAEGEDGEEEDDEEGIRVGYVIVSELDGSERPSLSAAQVESGAVVPFMELLDRSMWTVVGAGRLLQDSDSVAPDSLIFDTVAALNPLALQATSLLVKDVDRPTCTGEFDLASILPETTTMYRILVPKDVILDVQVEVTLPDDEANAGLLAVAEYLNSLDVFRSLGTESGDMVLPIMYRKKPTLTPLLQILAKATNVASDIVNTCENVTETESKTLFGLASQDITGPDQKIGGTDDGEVLVTFLVTEEYNSGFGDVNEDKTLVDVPGGLSVKDGISASPDYRKVVVGGVAGLPDDSGLPNLTEEECSGDGGCLITKEDTDATIGSVCTAAAPCTLGSSQYVGTVYQLKISLLSWPEREDPFTKSISGVFMPLGDGLGDAQRPFLISDEVQLYAVIEGDIPIAPNAAVQLPEYIPLLILRRPPGDGSVATWEKDTTVSIDLEFSRADRFVTEFEFESQFGTEYKTDVSVEGVASPGGFGASFGSSIGLTKQRIMPYFETEHEYRREEVVSDGSTVTLMASASYSTPMDIPGAMGDLFVVPSLAMRTVEVLPIRFENDGTACRGEAKTTDLKWQLLTGGEEADALEALEAFMETTETTGSRSGVKDALTAFDNSVVSEEEAAVAGAGAGAEADTEAATSDADVKAALELRGVALANYGRRILRDSSWNSVAVHSLWDILNIRLPQLQDACELEWQKMMCYFEDGNEYGFDFVRDPNTQTAIEALRTAETVSVAADCSFCEDTIDTVDGPYVAPCPEECFGTLRDLTEERNGDAPNNSYETDTIDAFAPEAPYRSVEKGNPFFNSAALDRVGIFTDFLDLVRYFSFWRKQNPLPSRFFSTESSAQGEPIYLTIDEFNTAKDYVRGEFDNNPRFAEESVEKLCAIPSDWMPDCGSLAEDTKLSEEIDMDFAMARFSAALEALEGWKEMVELNEYLKGQGTPVEANQLIQTPLVDRGQEFNVKGMLELGDAEKSFENVAEIPLTAGSTAGESSTKSFQSENAVTSLGATASVLSFTGGDSETTYSFSTSKTAKLDIVFDRAYDGEADLGFEFGFNVFGIGVKIDTETELGGGYSNTNTASDEREQATSVTFTLADDEVGDTFDVEIRNDPVYGTPVFQTMTGRSKCPHEPGTTPKEQWSFRFSDQNALDMIGSETLSDVRSVQRVQGAEAGTCASFYIEGKNLSPYGDILDLLWQLTTEQYDEDASLTGLRLEVDDIGSRKWFGSTTQLLKEKLWRVNICPEKDERDFEERNLLSGRAAGDPRGYVFCNVGVRTTTMCERTFWEELSKVAVYQDDMEPFLCSNAPDWNYCYTPLMESIFDGSRTWLDSDPVRFVTESPATAAVTIDCLSFHPTMNFCDQVKTPCNDPEFWDSFSTEAPTSAPSENVLVGAPTSAPSTAASLQPTDGSIDSAPPTEAVFGAPTSAPSTAASLQPTDGSIDSAAPTEAAFSAEEVATLTGSDTVNGDGFGISVDIQGRVAVVGAYLADTTAGANAGAAYMFHADASLRTWVETAKLEEPNANAGHNFGSSVALDNSGSRVIVGAPKHTSETVGVGAATVFASPDEGMSWGGPALITSGRKLNGDLFATSVGISGDFAIAGSPARTRFGLRKCGAAFIIELDASNGVSRRHELYASDPSFEARFGDAVTIDGLVAVIAAPRDSSVQAEAGSLYVFTSADGSSWSESFRLDAGIEEAAGNLLGTQVALSANLLVAGAPQTDTAADGAAFVFATTDAMSSWSAPTSISAIATFNTTEFGNDVDVSADYVIVGESGQLAAYIFRNRNNLWNLEGRLLPASSQPLGSNDGTAVATSAEVAVLASSGVNEAYVFLMT